MAKVLLAATFSLTLVRTCLVLDAVCSHGGIVGRAAQSTRRMLHFHPVSHRPLSSRPISMGRGGGAPKTRTLHVSLVGMHVAASLAQGAYVLEYTLPVSHTSCLVTFRAAVALLLCYEASLVLFLVAKTSVTNGTRTLACWEKAAVWLSRVYCWGYLYPVAIYLGITSRCVANDEGTHCYHETTSSDTNGVVINSCLLIVQLVVLLLLFVKPLLASQEGTQSGRALYRRVVYRNAVCTATIVTTTVITTVVTVLALKDVSPDNTKPRQIADIMPALNSFVTLCLTEIALPLGFTSAWKSVFGERPARAHDQQSAGVDGPTNVSRKAKAKVAPSLGTTSGTAGAVVPEEALPQNVDTV